MYVCMYVCMRKFITHGSYSLSSHECAPVGRTKKMSSACYRMMSVLVLDPEVTMANSSTVLGHRQQSCVVQKWKCHRLALSNRHERRSVSGYNLY